MNINNCINDSLKIKLFLKEILILPNDNKIKWESLSLT